MLGAGEARALDAGAKPSYMTMG